MSRIVARLFSLIVQHVCPALQLWLVIIVVPAIGRAQSNDTLQYSLRHFNDENGLPQNSVKSIVPGASGFIWLATENGVVRFDGHHFLIYNKDNTGFESSRIYSIIPSGIPNTYYAVTDREQVGEIQNGTIALVGNDTVKQNIYLQGHLLSVNPVKQYTAIGLPNIFSEGIRFRSYIIPLDATTWYSLDSGRIFINQHGQKRELARLRGTSPYNFFLLDSNLYYWSHRRGAIILDSARHTFVTTRVTGDMVQSRAWKTRRRPDKIYWNIAAGEVFFYLNQSLYKVIAMPDGSLHTRCILNHFNLPVNKVVSVYYDESLQQLFLGSLTNGLFVFKRKLFIPVQIRKEGQEVYYAQWPYDNDKVITPWGRILSPFYAGRHYSKLIYKNVGTTDQYSMTMDTRKNLWIKSRKSLFRFDSTGAELTATWKYTDDIDQIYADTAGNVWVGFHVRGLYHVPAGQNDPELYLPGIKNISCITRSGSHLWLGTSHGLYRIHIDSRIVDTIPQFRGRYIRSIYITRPGEVWVTTYDEGFYLYTRGKLTRFPQDRNNYLATAHCIVEDKKGFFWITTNKGLFQASKQDLLDYAAGRLRDVYYLYYTKENGFNTNEFNGGCMPCAVTLGNGYVSLPSLSGLVWFNPDSLRMELPDKDLYIDHLELDRQLLPVSDTMRLPRNFQQLKLHITTPYFGNKNNIRIEYALHDGGNRHDWLRVSDNKTILLSGMKAGRHYLAIRKYNGFGKDNYTYKNLVLIIAPAYYETWWFPLGVLLLVFLLIWGYSAVRVQYVRTKNKQLEQRIAERTGELEQTLAALQVSEEQLRRQTRIHERLITAMAHDIKSPLKYMTDAAWNLVKRSANQQGIEDIQLQSRLLFESGTRIYYFTDNLLQYIKLYARQGIITMEPVNLYNVVDEKVRIFTDIAAIQCTVIHNQVPMEALVNSNARLLGVIIHNIIDNAVKVTNKGTITITTTDEPDLHRISIADTGPGMREDIMDWCNTQPAPRDLPESMGMGLMIVKELLVLVNGRMEVERRGGTIVHILLKK
jgi:Signal transduction histidine kinase